MASSGEQKLETTVGTAEAKDTPVKIENPYNTEMKITVLRPAPGKGTILNPEVCLGKLLEPLKKNVCIVVQDNPPGIEAFGEVG
jgi:hypothetical protein